LPTVRNRDSSFPETPVHRYDSDDALLSSSVSARGAVATHKTLSTFLKYYSSTQMMLQSTAKIDNIFERNKYISVFFFDLKFNE
jgi:hypothetical protein